MDGIVDPTEGMVSFQPRSEAFRLDVFSFARLPPVLGVYKTSEQPALIEHETV